MSLYVFWALLILFSFCYPLKIVVFSVSKAGAMFLAVFQTCKTSSFCHFTLTFYSSNIHTVFYSMKCFCLFHITPWKDNSGYFLHGISGFWFAWFAVSRNWHILSTCRFCILYSDSVPLGFTGSPIIVEYVTTAILI